MKKPQQQAMAAGAQQIIGGAKEMLGGAMGGNGELLLPVKLDIHGMNLTFGDEQRWDYYIPDPMKVCVICCVPAIPGNAMVKEMEFRRERGPGSFKFSLPKKSCIQKVMAPLCCKAEEFVYAYKDDELIGKLEKPFRCCESQCEALDEMQGNDILQMSFVDAKEKEQFTLRRKGKGCCNCMLLCCCGPCNCKFRGLCLDGYCCCTEVDSRSDEIWSVHGPMEQPMQNPPKATVTLISRRGYMFGPVFQPVSVIVEGTDPDMKAENLLLLLGYVYGTIYQGLLAPIPTFPLKEGVIIRGGVQTNNVKSTE